jgi:hypothetical protein
MPDTKDVRRIRRSRDREVIALLLAVLHAGHRYKMTKSGIIIYGPEGICGTHFSVSDHRAAKNLRSDLRRCGITLPKGK